MDDPYAFALSVAQLAAIFLNLWLTHGARKSSEMANGVLRVEIPRLRSEVNLARMDSSAETSFSQGDPGAGGSAPFGADTSEAAAPAVSFDLSSSPPEP